jgi:hypothetical protein
MFISFTIFTKKYGLLVLYKNQGKAEMLRYNQSGFAAVRFSFEKDIKSVVVAYFKVPSQYLDGTDRKTSR